MAAGFPLELNGIRIRTSEALYQACRFPHRPELQRIVLAEASPMTAKMRTKPHRKDTRPDWDEVRITIMRWALRVKLAQHPESFGRLLLATGDGAIVEESRRDEFWGAKPQPDGTLVGANVLGRLLRELRDDLESGKLSAGSIVVPPGLQNFALCGRLIEPMQVHAERGPMVVAPAARLRPVQQPLAAAPAAVVARKSPSPTPRVGATPIAGDTPDMTITRKKLIEVALPLPEINDASAYDKMPGIGPHPKGVHHWWARLPLPAARAVLFASLVDDPSGHPEKWPTEDLQDQERERLFAVLREMMGKKLHEHPEVYAEARKEVLQHASGALPRVFDPFAGGGSIPLEANRLGLEAIAGDLNPVAVVLNRSNLELAPRWLNCAPVNPSDGKTLAGVSWRGTHGLAADVRYYSRLIRERATSLVGHLYPRLELPDGQARGTTKVIAWIWARTVASPNPAARGKHVPLLSSFMLSTKPRNMSWLEPQLDASAPDGWRMCVKAGTLPPERLGPARLGTKAGKGQDFRCLLTNTPIPRSYIQSEGKAGRLRRRLVAVVAEGTRGKLYADAPSNHELAAACESDTIQEARDTFLAGSLPTRAEITGGVCTAYGLRTWGHLFSDRQLTTLLAISDLIREVSPQVRSDALASGHSSDLAASYAATISTYLAFALDRCTDFNNSLCRWNSSNEKIMNLFGRQALPMVFDYGEANLLGDSVGGWTTCSEYVADCITTLGVGSVRGVATQLDASTDISEAPGLMVSTDPPYYNNISYATLSDFFYVWMRRTLWDIHADLFNTLFTPKVAELIASPDRFEGSREKAKQHFERGFRAAFTALRERIDTRFPLTVYYAFKQEDEDSGTIDEQDPVESVDSITGWETLLEALLSAEFQITATWPIRASQKWRMVSMGANALASYIVLACRPRSDSAPQADRRSFVAELKHELPGALRHLQQGNIAPVDFAQAAIGPGMAVYSQYSRVLESSGKPMSVRAALSLINQTLTEVLSEQEDDFDGDTRWAISWFEQKGFAEGDFGEAELLSKAKVTSVSGLQQAGVIQSKGGKVRLLRPDELSSTWDPTTDKRLTIWEMTHQLVRVYYHEKSGDEEAGRLLAQMGSHAEIARELAYRLFDICEKKKRSAEAQAYNALVLGWPEIAHFAREALLTKAQQPRLIGEE